MFRRVTTPAGVFQDPAGVWWHQSPEGNLQWYHPLAGWQPLAIVDDDVALGSEGFEPQRPVTESPVTESPVCASWVPENSGSGSPVAPVTDSAERTAGDEPVHQPDRSIHQYPDAVLADDHAMRRSAPPRPIAVWSLLASSVILSVLVLIAIRL
jgi:hypothetical protein